jgi:predicted nucleic acid-binding protein
VCLIVDANLAGAIFKASPDPELAPVIDWLRKDGRLVFGGLLRAELMRLVTLRGLLVELQRQGKALRIPDADVAREETAVLATGHCVSNDGHVVALARVSGARTLCTHDRDLQTDFRNPRLVSKPRGSIYQRRNHARLLRHTSSCRWRPDGL